jgi:hypothetical protein
MIIELSPGITVDMHPATGRDSLIALSVRARMESFVPEYNIVGGFSYQDDFAHIVAQIDQVKGLDFALPHWELDGELLADSFRAWLALPDRIVQAWRNALDKVEPEYNAFELRPGAKPDNPLQSNPAESSENPPTTG